MILPLSYIYNSTRFRTRNVKGKCIGENTRFIKMYILKKKTILKYIHGKTW